MERFNTDKAIYPLLGLFISVYTLIYSIKTVKDDNVYIFYIAIFVLYLLFGYYKACLGVLPVVVFLCVFFAGLTYIISHNTESTINAIYRGLGVSFMVVPGLATPVSRFIKSLRQTKLPPMITLGMMITINFFPLFSKEMKQIRNAMKVRGINSLWNPKAFYRAFLIPLVVRIVNISDTLSASVETRGFSKNNKEVNIYEPIKIGIRDILFTVLFIATSIVVVVI